MYPSPNRQDSQHGRPRRPSHAPSVPRGRSSFDRPPHRGCTTRDCLYRCSWGPSSLLFPTRWCVLLNPPFLPHRKLTYHLSCDHSGHVADTPERSQIASCMMNVCPSCDSGLSELSVLRQLVGGQHDGRPLPLHRHPKLRVAYASAKPVVFRTHAESQAVRNTGSIKAINALGLHAPRVSIVFLVHPSVSPSSPSLSLLIHVLQPYADGFPACDPHHLVLPDLLHQKKWMHDTLFMNWIVGRAKERGPSVNSLSSKLNRWFVPFLSVVEGRSTRR